MGWHHLPVHAGTTRTFGRDTNEVLGFEGSPGTGEIMKYFPKWVLVVSTLGIALGYVSHGAELSVPKLGATPCEEVVRISSATDQNNSGRREIEQWGQGYLSGLMTAHTIQFSRSSDEVMGTAIAIDYDTDRSWVKIVAHCEEVATDNLAQAVMAVAIELGVLQDEAPSVPGVYLLIEVNGKQLPAVRWVSRPNGEQCKKEILQGALFFDDAGKSAAFLTERDYCLNDDGSQSAAKEKSVIFPGSYIVSGNQITIEDDFGTDQATLNGNTMLYTTGGKDEPITEFAFQRN